MGISSPRPFLSTFCLCPLFSHTDWKKKGMVNSSIVEREGERERGNGSAIDLSKLFKVIRARIDSLPYSHSRDSLLGYKSPPPPFLTRGMDLAASLSLSVLSDVINSESHIVPSSSREGMCVCAFTRWAPAPHAEGSRTSFVPSCLVQLSLSLLLLPISKLILVHHPIPSLVVPYTYDTTDLDPLHPSLAP